MILVVLAKVWDTAWTWLKVNWRWVLFPLGILGLILGWSRKTTVTVESPAIDDAAKKQQELDAQKAAQDAALVASKDAALKVADNTADAKTGALVATQTAAAPALEQDVEALNLELQQVGKAQRGPSQ